MKIIIEEFWSFMLVNDLKGFSQLTQPLKSHCSMASSSNRGGYSYGAAPYRSREGLSTRQGAGSDEIQLRIDPMHADLDDEISGLRKQVRQLKNVASEIESEAKYQNEFVNQLQMTLIKAQAGVKNNMRKLNKSIIQSGSSNVLHVVLFALFCLFLVYLWSKFSRR
ncbi:hypothetical protein L1987_13717 [Smallanthus sonchifolius]|uniref:Uncharacterized protein n=1 Tax=Smallanthus sonchifolius TaxID=185202 RepID=A0ACB9JJD8_9ASTR|nr:hypothetical protein L1987_13717 [Smallanthus sonchifolius]